jgi:hypothetical protein
MQKYAIRIELNGSPAPAVYERLHAIMSACNTARRIRGDDGALYELPHATYVGESSDNAMIVRDVILTDVQSIWADCDVIVFRYDQAAWRLSPVGGKGRLAA